MRVSLVQALILQVLLDPEQIFPICSIVHDGFLLADFVEGIEASIQSSSESSMSLSSSHENRWTNLEIAKNPAKRIAAVTAVPMPK